ncbi:hypothetical protein D3C81_2072360 [compost metagenome]
MLPREQHVSGRPQKHQQVDADIKKLLQPAGRRRACQGLRVQQVDRLPEQRNNGKAVQQPDQLLQRSLP